MFVSSIHNAIQRYQNAFCGQSHQNLREVVTLEVIVKKRLSQNRINKGSGSASIWISFI